MKTCEDFEQLAGILIDGEATHSEREQLYGHLANCKRCDAFFVESMAIQIGVARRGLHRFPTASSKPPRFGSLRPAVRQGTGTILSGIMKKSLSIPVPVLGTVLAIVIALFFILSDSKQSKPNGQVFQAVRVNQTTVSLPVVRIP